MDIVKVLKICIVFLIGFLVANILNYYIVYGLENPFNENFSINNNSNNAPHDFIKEDQIEIYPDKIIIYIENASLGRYAPTGSMKPLFDEYSNGIRIIPKNEDEIYIGDIITFKEKDYLVVHRVIEIGSDDNGIYFITKGDNNTINDGKIRFKDIKYKTIGILW
jgi:signal peptidase I